MPIAGHRSRLKTHGDAVAVTGEACTLDSSTLAHITNAARRVIDPTAAVAVYDNAVLVAATSYTFDYLFGKVTRTTGTFTGPVTVDASYLPMLEVAEVTAWKVNQGRTELDKTKMGDTDKSFLLGLKQADGDAELFDLPSSDLDSGAGSVVVETLFGAGASKLLELTLNPDTGVYWRGWIRWVGVDLSAPLDELVKVAHKWKSTAFKGTGQDEFASFSIGS